jgi:hypothetical protein
MTAEPWPGRPLRGRNNQGRAEMCWLPVAPGLTPHGLRHSLKSLMGELRTSEVLSHDRLGHRMGGIAGIYNHVTPVMRAELMDALTECWERALEARATMNPHSPVPVLDALLQEAARKHASTGPPGNQRTGQLPNSSQKPENEEPSGSRLQDRLPSCSQNRGSGVHHQIKRLLNWYYVVGVAGFEPAASSSRRQS